MALCPGTLLVVQLETLLALWLLLLPGKYLELLGDPHCIGPSHLARFPRSRRCPGQVPCPALLQSNSQRTQVCFRLACTSKLWRYQLEL